MKRGPVALVAGVTLIGALLATIGEASGSTRTFLGPLASVKTLASTTPKNGDENPYAVSVVPVTTGSLVKGEVLVDNFNARSNDQGTGSTLVEVSPSGHVKTFAIIPPSTTCPGGIGLSTALAVFTDGLVIVGSAPSTNGTVATSGAGCLIVLSSTGRVLNSIVGPKIDGPWDLASIDHGSAATLFVTNTLFGVKAGGAQRVNRGTLLRIQLHLSAAGAQVLSETVVASGLPEQASAGAFVLGPTGVAIVGTTAYVTEPLENAVLAIANATTRTSSAGTGRIFASKGDLHHPIAMVSAPNKDLLVVNGLNGDVVEINAAGQQVSKLAIDPDPAQSPAGSGDLFGLAVAPSGRALYFAKDDTNTLAELS